MKSDGLLIKPAPSFDEPVDMLRACHERITAQCATLEKLAAHLPSYGADTQAQQAARNIMRYFDLAAPHHHADEEQDLFPVLIEISQRQCSSVGERIASLLDEHRSLEASWAQLRTALADVAQGKKRPLERAWVADFVDAYLGHIALEEREIFPFAEACLDRQQLASLSAAMVARRTIVSQ
ncbi:hemerythrin domain-containing protein [Burkholderia territorii]|uniref:hemerythrin domain-containing protein n=1 Tax=Burkholderia territorii TaxID=1503055 RepID=UPI00075EEB2F|nr:hemerythrin domain-containing protein [Burkholderia territorii]KVQ69169.1 hemerythrin [Burkholderia territorii]